MESTEGSTKGGSSNGIRRGRKWVLIVLVAILAVGAILFFQNRAKRSSAKQRTAPVLPAPMISTVTARKGDIGDYVWALGSVTALNTVDVRSRVDGQLEKVHFVEGGPVHEGDLVAEIDRAPFAAAVTQAEGQLARDQALLENARLDLQRYTEAYSRNAIPKQQLDTQVATVHQYEGTVKLDQGLLENARVQLAYCSIVAPLTGRVGLQLIDPGNIVHATDTNPIVVITQVQPINVTFSVAEDYLPQIRQQLRLGKQLAIDAMDRTQRMIIATGVLDTIDNQIDPATGTVRIKGLFSNKDDSLFPNQFVNVRLLVDTHHDVTLVPNPAIQRNAQGAFVFLLRPDHTVEVHPITVVTTDGTTSEVTGLEPGAIIAADNFSRLTDGMKVNVRPPAAEKPQQTPP